MKHEETLGRRIHRLRLEAGLSAAELDEDTRNHILRRAKETA